MNRGDLIPDELLDRTIGGLSLVPGSLRDQLGPRMTLLVFLRHFGCIFCRETLSDIRAMAESDPDFPKPLFFFQGNPTEGRAFLRKYWPTLRAVADPTGALYKEFGIERGGFMKMLGPSVWAAKARAEGKGHSNGERTGDIWRLPGVFLVNGNRVLWSHDFRHAGDLPDYRAIVQIAKASA